MPGIRRVSTGRMSGRGVVAGGNRNLAEPLVMFRLLQVFALEVSNAR